MNRTHLIASMVAAIGSAMLFASAAQACISCEYVPEVLNASKNNSHGSYRPTPSTDMRAQAARAGIAKAQMLKAQAAKAQMAKAMAAKARAAAAKKVETASLTRPEERTDKALAVKAIGGKDAESSAAGSGSSKEKVVSTATLLVGESVSSENAPGEPVECKKFIAAIGTTVTVPCK
ncbi:MAG: hypothetical protein K0S42_3441 [Microvirga sp.]|nr:hypothetical protein [Microvirga sp.]